MVLKALLFDAPSPTLRVLDRKKKKKEKNEKRFPDNRGRVCFTR